MFGLYKIETNELVVSSPEPYTDVAEGFESREIVELPLPGYDPLRLADPEWPGAKSWPFLKCLFLTEVTHERQTTKEGQDRDAMIAGGYVTLLKTEFGIDLASKEVVAQRAKVLNFKSAQIGAEQVQLAARMYYGKPEDLDEIFRNSDKLVAYQDIVSELLKGTCKWLP